MHHTLRRGDIIVARIPFSSDDGSGRASKQRPVLVMDIDDGSCRVRPIHGSNSFVRRAGLGRRIRDWKAAGLTKPSIVSAADHWVGGSRAGRPIGRLSDQDRRRLFDD